MEMISRLLQAFRRSSYSPAEGLLLDCLDADTSVEAGVVMIGGPLLGEVVNYSEWLLRGDGIDVKIKKSNRITGSENVVHVKQEKVDVLREIIAKLEDAQAHAAEEQDWTIKDGLSYTIAWGERGKIRKLVLRNPLQGSRLEKLMQSLLCSELPLGFPRRCNSR